MKIGVIISDVSSREDSLVHVFGSTIEALQQEHQLIYRQPGYTFHSEEWQRNMFKDIILSCDLLLGRLEPMVLEVRRDVNKNIPYLCYMLGSLPRGNSAMKRCHHLFRTTDVLLVNCTGDLELVNKYFENARAKILPFAVNESEFYPLDDASKQAIRAEMGIGAKDKVLLYSGRITLEKNVHTILRIFSVIQRIVPNTRLIIAGRYNNIPFPEFGAYPLNIKGALDNAIASLGINQDSVSFIGHKSKIELRHLYNIADVMVNMTLHHDENFGLSQVEAMACGTPVVGTNWGGLKDTIIDGETGYKVSTIATGSGIKLDWWEAVNKLVFLLQNDSERQQLRQQCVNIVHKKYSLVQYRENLRSILEESGGDLERAGAPLKASEFAMQYWANPSRLYKELITPYTGSSQDGEATTGRLKADHLVFLANPLSEIEEGLFEINDPIFPLNSVIPKQYKRVACTVIEVMRLQPVITLGRLIDNYLVGQPNVLDALEWMIEEGLILRSGNEHDVISTDNVSSQMSLPLFSFQNLSSCSDFAVLR